MVRLFIIEDQQLVRNGLFAAIANRLEVQLVGTFSSGKEALAAGDLLAQADVGLIDIDLGEEQAFDFMPLLRAQHPSLKYIWVTAVATEYMLNRAIDEKLHGFVHKDDEIDVLITAIERVAAGGEFQSETVRKMQARFRQNAHHFEKLFSEREQRLLELLGQGLSNDEIGAIIGISPATVRTHRQNIMARLDLHNATELIAYAIKTGFSTPGKVQSPFRKK